MAASSFNRGICLPNKVWATLMAFGTWEQLISTDARRKSHGTVWLSALLGMHSCSPHTQKASSNIPTPLCNKQVSACLPSLACVRQQPPNCLHEKRRAFCRSQWQTLAAHMPACSCDKNQPFLYLAVSLAFPLGESLKVGNFSTVNDRHLPWISRLLYYGTLILDTAL